MLTTSPILASSAKASPPASFHRSHAPAQESPRSSPSRTRRPSSQAASSSSTGALARSPSLQRPRSDAALQNAPQHPPSLTPAAAPAVAVSPAQLDPAPSPNKKRGSPAESLAHEVTASESAGQSQPDSATTKRPKANEHPPKALPQQYEHCAVDDMVELIAHMLSELITTNDAIRISSGGLTRFHSRTAPGISVRDYLHRLARHATLTPPLLLAIVYYIDRLCALYQEFTINTLTVHRSLITAATVAAKGLSDSFWNNTTYARVGGVRVAELKLLELEFLYRVDWKIVPNPEVLVAYYRGLVERTPGYALESEGISDHDMGGGGGGGLDAEQRGGDLEQR